MSHDPPSKDRRHFLTTSSVLGAAGVLWSALPFANAVPMPTMSTPLASTCSATGRRRMPPVTITGIRAAARMSRANSTK